MATVKVDKVAYDFKNLEVALVAGGKSFGIIDGLEEIEYQCNIEREKFYGPSRLPVIRTEGQADFEASITMARYWWQYIVRRTLELGLTLAGLEMALSVSYVKPGQPIATDTLWKAALSEITNSHTNGPEHLMVPCPIDIMNIYYQGVDVFGNRLGQ